MTTLIPHSSDHSSLEFYHPTPFPRAGTAELECSFINNRTVLTRSLATSPLRIINPRTASPAAWIFTSSFGGGLLSGDHLSLTLQANEHTTTYLSTQSSTKIYRSTQDRPAQQTLNATLHDHATLILTPDPIVPYADSRYEQSQHFHLTGTSNLILLDAFTSGRRAKAGGGEHWNLASLKSRNTITLNKKRILTDTLHLSQSNHLTSPFRLANFHYFATLILLGPKLAQHAQQLLHYTNAHHIEPDAPLLLSASPLADGILLRLASTNTELATQALHSSLAFLPTFLGEHPWNRKW